MAPVPSEEDEITGAVTAPESSDSSSQLSEHSGHKVEEDEDLQDPQDPQDGEQGEEEPMSSESEPENLASVAVQLENQRLELLDGELPGYKKQADGKMKLNIKQNQTEAILKKNSIGVAAIHVHRTNSD